MALTLLNNVAIEQATSQKIRENIVQEFLVIPGRGADFSYVPAEMALGYVDIQRLKMDNGGREVGASKNGGFWNTEESALESQIVRVALNIVEDKVVPVPKLADDMNGRRLLEQAMANVYKRAAKTGNKGYFASVLKEALNSAITATSAAGVVTYAISEDIVTKETGADAASAMAAFNEAVANLTDGDTANGFDTFELYRSQAFGTYEFFTRLQNNVGMFSPNTIAQEMVASGSFSAFDASYRPSMVRGYLGEIKGILVYQVGSLFKETASTFLGQRTLSDDTKAALASDALDNLEVIIVNGDAVAGGMELGDVKVTDATRGQGWLIQPLTRFGFKAFSPKGIQLITKAAGLDASDFVTYTGALDVATKTKVLDIYAIDNR